MNTMNTNSISMNTNSVVINNSGITIYNRDGSTTLMNENGITITHQREQGTHHLTQRDKRDQGTHQRDQGTHHLTQRDKRDQGTHQRDKRDQGIQTDKRIYTDKPPSYESIYHDKYQACCNIL